MKKLLFSVRVPFTLNPFRPQHLLILLALRTKLFLFFLWIEVTSSSCICVVVWCIGKKAGGHFLFLNFAWTSRSLRECAYDVRSVSLQCSRKVICLLHPILLCKIFFHCRYAEQWFIRLKIAWQNFQFIILSKFPLFEYSFCICLHIRFYRMTFCTDASALCALIRSIIRSWKWRDLRINIRIVITRVRND